MNSTKQNDIADTFEVVVTLPSVEENTKQDDTTSILKMLMKEVVYARTMSQSALQRLRSESIAGSTRALSELRRAQQELTLCRQNLLKALAVHQGLQSCST